MNRLFDHQKSSPFVKKIMDISDESFQNNVLQMLVLLCFLNPVDALVRILFGIYNPRTFYVLQIIISAVCLILILLYFVKKSTNMGYQVFRIIVQKYRWLIFIMLFIIWEIISSLVTSEPYISLYGTPHRSEGLIGRVLYLAIFAGAMILTRDRKIKVLNYFAVSGTLLVIPYILAKVPILSDLMLRINNPYLNSNSTAITSVFYHHNHYGYFLCMLILCIAGLFIMEKRVKKIVLYAAMLAVNTWAILMCDTFGSFLGALIALVSIVIIMSINRKKIYWRGFIPLLVFFLVIMVTDVGIGFLKSNFFTLGNDVLNIVESGEQAANAGTGRWRLWTQAIEFIKSSPLFGYGEDGVTKPFMKLGFVQDRPANEYLTYAIFFGIPGVFLYLAFLINLAMNRIKKLYYLDILTIVAGSVVIAYAVSAMFGNSAYNTTVYFFLFLGMVSDLHLDHEDASLKKTITSKDNYNPI